jgi:hypothetical protein
MPAIVLQNNLEADGPISPPMHTDGRGYLYCMYFHGDLEVAFADSYEELMDVLIPGYNEMTDEDQAFNRIRLAQAAAAQVQAAIIASVEEGELSEAEYEVLMAPRAAKQPRADWWRSEVPLVAVETSYQPFTDVPRPASALSATADAPNLWWVRPAEDEDLLLSLHEIGYLRLMENIDLAEASI